MNTFKSTEIFAEIAEAADKHKNQQLNFRFKAPEMLKLMEHLADTPEMFDLVSEAFKDALDKSDKRPMTEQLNLKARYQKSHGLVFKDIPIHVQRHVIFDAILKLGRTMDFETGRLMFPGGCKLRSFFFPQIKHQEQSHRVCFPIFVNKKDQMFIYQWAQNQNGKIQLDVSKDCGWDGIVSVELTRDATTEDADETASMSSQASSVMKGFSPMGFPQFYPPANPFTMPFTHGGPINPYNNFVHPQLIPQPQYPALTATTAATTPTNEKVDAVVTGMSQLSVDGYSQSESPSKSESMIAESS